MVCKMPKRKLITTSHVSWLKKSTILGKKGKEMQVSNDHLHLTVENGAINTLRLFLLKSTEYHY